MKKLILFCAFGFIFILIHATGVVINKNNDVFSPIRLQSCHYIVDIQNQVSAVTVIQSFINNEAYNIMPRYYFPVPRGASATQLRWFIHNQWHTAIISGTSQNPQGGPSDFPLNFVVYISLMPTVFDFNELMLPNDSLRVEITYAQLLPYTFGSVNQILKNDYSAIQTYPLQLQQLDLTLTTDRLITAFNLNIPGATITNTGNYATAHVQITNAPATTNYSLIYALQQTSNGIQVISTQKDSIPDGFGQGFFFMMFEPSNAVVSDSLPKKITLVIDHSGSMYYENKIEQAKNAFNYILDQLNSNDMFNVVTFDHLVVNLWANPQPVTPANIAAGHQFINAISAIEPNGTNISGALNFSISQYYLAPPTYNNVIFFLTDGQPTVGIQDSYQLINNIDNLVAGLQAEIKLFTFGIGSDVNYQLLSILSDHNNGTAIFLGDFEIYSTVTQFYSMMHYAPMDSVALNVTPLNGISEVYPIPLPNIYNGSQTIITGRYSIPQYITFNLSGNINSNPVNYEYSTNLSAITDTLLQFVPKLWASKKIDHLLMEYYTYPSNSPEALLLKQQIIDLSIAYGVVCVFTSFTGDDTPNEDELDDIPAAEIILMGNYPNPFNPETTIRIRALKEFNNHAFIEIYNLKGQLVRNLAVWVNQKGIYEVRWDGRNNNGKMVSSGTYFYKITIGNHILTGKMLLLK